MNDMEAKIQQKGSLFKSKKEKEKKGDCEKIDIEETETEYEE